jgi:XTP/dITP diphosphohydrolase
MRRLLLATKNAHKTTEVAALLGPGWQVADLTAYPHIPAPEETGTTFAANAALKALAAARHFPGLVLADDSGLEVEALGGAPGVFSARYAGPQASDAANRARLLRELRAFPSPARFRCVLVLVEGEKVLAECSGTVEGAIIGRERGAGGFGYDALFVPEGFTETFAELPVAVKNTLSHRARAFVALRDFLEKER